MKSYLVGKIVFLLQRDNEFGDFGFGEPSIHTTLSGAKKLAAEIEGVEELTWEVGRAGNHYADCGYIYYNIDEKELLP